MSAIDRIPPPNAGAMPSGWVAHKDPVTGKTFYHNETTKVPFQLTTRQVGSTMFFSHDSPFKGDAMDEPRRAAAGLGAGAGAARARARTCTRTSD